MKELIGVILVLISVLGFTAYLGMERTKEIDRILELNDCHEYDKLRNNNRIIYICKEKEHE